jgi:2-polyprenyl-3-methyl-5-hydroxy-6-metoxy-1,4-benzoquinol methylase
MLTLPSLTLYVRTQTCPRGEHIHHGYWPTPASKASDTKETAQLNLIRLLLSISALSTESYPDATTRPVGAAPPPPEQPLRILDVGCGIGGTSRYLASTLGASVTGITISSKQVQIARRLSKAAAAFSSSSSAAAAGDGQDATTRDGEQPNRGDSKDGDDAGAKPTAPKQKEEETFIPIGSSGGRVRFLELDAEKMSEYFLDNPESEPGFDVVWISEALSHFPDKAGFFRNAAHLICERGGMVVVADWFKAEGLSEAEFERDIKPIEGLFSLFLAFLFFPFPSFLSFFLFASFGRCLWGVRWLTTTDGMLLPPLCTQQDYVDMAKAAGLELLGGPKDISQDVSKTWYVLPAVSYF